MTELGRRRLRLALGIAFSLGFLLLALRGIAWGAFVQALGRTRPLPLVGAVAAALVGVYLRTWRWRAMVAPIKALSTRALLPAMMIGALANNVLPARIGELVRAHVLGRAEGISRMAALASIVYERIVDVFAALALTGLALLAAPGPPWLRHGALWILVFNSALLLLTVLAVRRQAAGERLVGRLAGRLSARLEQRALEAFRSTVQGMSTAADARALVPIVSGSALVLAASVAAVWASLRAMGLEALPWHAAVALTVVVSFASMIPAAPGNIGPVQYACVVGLALYGVDDSPALAFSLVYHASQYLPVTLLGALYLPGQPAALRLGADPAKAPAADE